MRIQINGAGLVVLMYKDTGCYTWWIQPEGLLLHGECSHKNFDNVEC